MICIPNIGPKQQAMRRTTGLVVLAAAAVVATMLYAFRAPWWAWSVLFLPLWVASLCFFQSYDWIYHFFVFKSLGSYYDRPFLF